MKAGSAPTTAPALALAALGLVMIGGLGLGVRIFREHGSLKAELAALRAAQSPGATEDHAPPTAESANLAAEIERESSLLRAAQAKAAELAKTLPPMSDEEWRSLGRVEELGRQAAEFIGSFSGMLERVKRQEMTNEFDEKRFFHNLTGLMKRMEAIGEMEDMPDEIARLHTATLCARMKLDDAMQVRVRQEIEREFSKLSEQKLTRPQRPATEREDWYARRKSALDEATLRIEALIPAAQRQQFAVGQSLHLGTGMTSNTSVLPDGRRSINLLIQLPGIDYRY